MSSTRRSTGSGKPTRTHFARSAFVVLPLLVSLALGGCFGDSNSVAAPAAEDEHVGHSHAPLWVNGGFESDAIGAAPSGWTLQNNRNNGITDTRPAPQTLASLNLAAGGSLQSTVQGGATESQADPALGTGASLRFPKYGQRSLWMNNNDGTNRNVNVARQTMTVAAGDIDPLDGEVHVRFALAPVLENPSHTYVRQPYYYVELRNITKGNTVLYQDFNTSAQPGVPWKTSNGVYYTDWQLVDISPGTASLAIGDQVEIVVVAAGCSLGGHWGRVYLDGVGSTIPGVYTWATGPQQANAGSNITYTVNYRNGGSTNATSSQLRFATPPNTTFQAVSLGSPTCTAPAVGGTGNVVCSLGTLAPGQQGSFTITVQIGAGTAAGTVITEGNYDIAATGLSPLLGPKVKTTVTTGVTYADVSVTKTNAGSAVGWNGSTSYTITVQNAGPNATPTVTVNDTIPAQLTSASWTCAGSGGGTCAASGSGGINTNVNLPVGGSVTFTLNATVINGTGQGTVVNAVTATVGGGVTDSNTTNNTDADQDFLGTLRSLTVTKTSASSGTVLSAPAGISCGTGCTSASSSFIDGNTVVLTATPAAGAGFGSWGGACASAGTATTCTLTMTGNQSVTASFIPAGTTVAVSSGGAQSTVVNTAFGSPLVAIVRDASNTPLAGVPVTFTVPASGASATLSTVTVLTDASGLASVNATANTVAGSYNVTASVPGVTTPATFALTNTPGAASSIVASAGGSQSTTVGTAFAQSLDARVLDAFGNPVPNVTVTFVGPGSGASASFPNGGSATTDATGHAVIVARANTVAGGPYNATATVGGVASPATFALTNLPGAQAGAAISGGDAQSTQVTTAFASALSVTVVDAFGNPVPNVTVTFSAPGAGASATLSGGGTATTDAAGVATVTATAGAVAGSYSVTTTIAGVAAPPSFSLTNTPGPATSLQLTSGGGQSTTVATSFAAPLVVTAYDAQGNVVPGVLVTFAPPSTGATASLDAVTVVTDASGQATVQAAAGTRAGSYSVGAHLSNPAIAVAIGLTNTPGAPASIAAVDGASPQAAQTGTPFAEPLEVVVLDAYGNPVPNTTITFTAPQSGATATLSATTAMTDASGHASITADAGATLGSYFVVATTPGLPPVAFTLTNLSSGALTVAVESGSPQTTTVGTAFAAPLVATVRDAMGQPVANAPVVFRTSTAGASASLDATVVLTDAAGHASVSATANTRAGDHFVTASTLGATAPAVFDLTNTPGAPVAIVLDPGSSPQRTTVGTDFARPLGLVVVDAFGNPVPGVDVTFTAPGSGATGTPSATMVVTDANGHASITVTASGTAGAYTIDASVTGIGSPTSFSLENLAGVPTNLAIASGDRQSTLVGTAFGSPLGVIVRNGSGAPVVGQTVTFTVPATGASATAQTFSVDTDSSGLASLPVSANLVSGAYVVLASTADSSAPAVFHLTNTAGAPASITASVLGTPQSQLVEKPFANELLVLVLDANGNPVPNATVTYTAPATGASATLSSTTVTTDVNGQARVRAIANTRSGAYAVTASVSGVATPASFSLHNLSGIPATIRLVSGDAQSAGAGQTFANPLVFEVLDSLGNPVEGVPVTLTLPTSGAGATCAPADPSTGADGRVSVSCTANLRTGAFTLGASAPGTATPVAVMLTNVALATTTTLVATPTTARIGGVVSLEARVSGASGTPTGTVVFTVDGVEVGRAVLDSGVASFDLLADQLGTSNVVATYVPSDPYATSSSTAVPVTVIAAQHGGVVGGAVCAVGEVGRDEGNPLALLFVLGTLGLVRLRRRRS